ncbi:MAG: M15 family metallopeptidase [Candidatus Pacebacteria bacterium]|nr:M15 family metallopeptidase [Candidatus Paceibacterota bacterium]
MHSIPQNPNNFAPAHINERQQILTVQHLGFDDEMHEGVIIMHEEVAEDVLAFFELALDLRFPIEKIVLISDERYQWNDELSMADNNTSGFNYRTIMDTDRLSNHATGRAFDVNPKQNIYLKRAESGEILFSYPEGAVYNLGAKGTLTKEHPLVIFMKERGWEWGGDWQRGDGVVDYQHFEKP